MLVQHITDPSSHNEDAVDAGGRDGCPSDSQAALNKNYVHLSDESDQADDELALVTSGPVSAHTWSKCIGASRKGDGGTRPVGDDETTYTDVILAKKKLVSCLYRHIIIRNKKHLPERLCH